MKKRAYALLGGIVVLLGTVSARLWILSRDSLEAASVQQSSRVQTIAVSRGTLYDRYMQPLVNRYYGVKASVTPYEPMLEALRMHGEKEAERYVKGCAPEGERVVVPLSSWLPPTVGIAQVWAPDRYGAEALACHLIGYINGDSTGVSGMEKVFDEVLSRYSGSASVSYQVDALGRAALQGAGRVENTLQNAKGGVVLTLDAQIQAMVQQTAAERLERGAVLVSSADSGEILAAVSLPLFDPNRVESALSREDSPLLDRTRINYDLGSVFKLVTAAAALENGISPDTVYVCRGCCRLQGATVYCHNPLGDGALTMREAMIRSCNCYFIELALDLGADTIRELAQRFGFSAALDIVDGYETSRALMPTEEELTVEAALANYAIGQGTLMATPYHIHALMASLVRDGVWCVPSIYRGEVNEKGETVRTAPKPEEERVLSARTAKELCSMLEAVVREGTGQAAMPTEGTAAGKTGTAETGWSVDGEPVVQSWFTGYYPAENPAYIITVLSENGGTNGRTAAPVFRAVCEELTRAGLVEKATPNA